jgi:hypothetical protein
METEKMDKKQRDPMKGKYCKIFKEEFAKARERLAPLGGKLEYGENDYEAFIFKMPGLHLIFYPHMTSAGNRHIRVRSAGKTDRQLLKTAIFALAENSCTFQYPMDRKLHQDAVMAFLRDGD